MARRPRRILLPLLFLAGLGLVSLENLQAQPALDALLERIPAAETGDSNRYSLTDVQYALGLDLDWNPLLRRAQLRDANETPLLTLLAGSDVGHVGADWVRWSQAPRMNTGQLFVSQEILVSLFSKYPDLRPQGWEQTETPADSIEAFPGEAPSSDSDSPSFPGDNENEIRNLMALVYPVSEYVMSASAEARGATEVLTESLAQALSEKGIGLKSLPSDAKETDISEAKADALLAFWIESGSPVAPGAFFVYDSPSISTGPSALTEWGRVDLAQQSASQRLARNLAAGFLESFGEGRTLGLRKGPIGSLQGRSIPSVMVFFGVDSAHAESEIRKLAQTIANALSAKQEKG